MKAWSHLPNATHIDAVVAAVGYAVRGAAWGAAQDAVRGDALDAAWVAAWDAARGAAWDAARGAALDAALDAARGAAYDAAWGAAYDAAWEAAWDAVSALVAWDECGVYISRDVSAEFMRNLLEVNPELHAVRLLLPYKTFLECVEA